MRKKLSTEKMSIVDPNSEERVQLFDKFENSDENILQDLRKEVFEEEPEEELIPIGDLGKKKLKPKLKEEETGFEFKPAYLSKKGLPTSKGFAAGYILEKFDDETRTLTIMYMEGDVFHIRSMQQHGKFFILKSDETARLMKDADKLFKSKPGEILEYPKDEEYLTVGSLDLSWIHPDAVIDMDLQQITLNGKPVATFRKTSV